MTYDTVITSKGTITIAAPLRKAMGLRTGQRVKLSVNPNNQIILDSGTDMKAFEALRAEVTKKIPDHLKGLSGDPLREAAASAWIDGYRD
jgi:bifunctional DNA-binding transcriptional regulator/antitoxin component of YhaV-PrlF toxin-antitoxin module